jgi:hypothetical protein
MIYTILNENGEDVTGEKEWVLSPLGRLYYICDMTGELMRNFNCSYKILR